MLEMFLKLSSTLNPGIANLTNFGRVKFVPFPLMEFLVEFRDELRMDEVQKSIANVTIVLNYDESTL